jgi:hypothetical protein
MEVGSALANGQINVRIYVTVDQDGPPYGKPISNFPLLIVAPSGERSTVRTDDAGAIALPLARGVYRIASVQPLEWNGNQYVWDLPLQVEEGMHALELTPRTAAQTWAGGATAASTAPIDASASSPLRQSEGKEPPGAPPAYLYKNPGTAALLSFLLPGLGQMYNGQVGKGIGLLLVSSAGTAVFVKGFASAASCNLGGNCSSSAAPIVLGAGVALAASIYSIVDARRSAKRINARRGFRAGAIPLRPYVGAQPGGRTAVGLSLAVR